MTEFNDPGPELDYKFPEEITTEQYHAAFMALLDFAGDEADRELDIGDIWVLGRQINTVILANTDNLAPYRMFPDYPEPGEHLIIRPASGNNLVTIKLGTTEDGKPVPTRYINIRLNLHENPRQSYWSHAYDKADEPKVHRAIKINEAMDTFEPNGQHNIRFGQISREMVYHLLNCVDEPEDLRDELLRAKIPHSMPPSE